MKFLVVGAGASGVISAIIHKRNHPNDDVLIIEHLDKPLKKILATGNGKCNLGNSSLDFGKYSNSKIAKSIIEEFPLSKQLDFFDSISIKTKCIDELIYPMSESAVSVREALLSECEKIGVNIKCDESLIDYSINENGINIKTTSSNYNADKLVIACGGFSSPKLGSDGSIFSILKKHNYNVIKCEPGLCPIHTKESTKILDGVRVKGTVSLIKNGKKIHEEKGEVLFKDHGLSGIVIFNISSIIAKDITADYKISIDIVDSYNVSELENYRKSHANEGFLRAFLHPKMISYINSITNNNNDIIRTCKELTFTFKSLYGFDFSQVSVGGLSVNEITESLESKKERGVYFSGEILDVDGPCGGYNLMWAFASGMKIGE